MIDARAFGPSQETRDARRAIAAAGTANKAAGLVGSGVPYADVGLGLASLFTDPTPEGAAKFVGQTITSPQAATTAASLLGSAPALNPQYAADLANLGLTAGSLGSTLASAGSGLLFSGFAGGGPFKALLSDAEPSERIERRMRRNRDAQSLTGETRRGLTERDLDAPVGGANVGNTLASILNFNQGGGWYTDTSHGWLPDPALPGLQGLLHARGFPGTQVENGQIVRREPTRGDVGGVGEMVAGGGPMLPPEQRRYLPSGFPTFTPGTYASNYSGDIQHGGENREADLAAGSQGGAVGWDRLLRQLSGQPGEYGPETFAPPFDQASGYGVPPKFVEGHSEDGTPGLFVEPQAALSPEYLSQATVALGPDVAERMRQAAQTRAEARAAMSVRGGGAWSNAP